MVTFSTCAKTALLECDHEATRTMNGAVQSYFNAVDAVARFAELLDLAEVRPVAITYDHRQPVYLIGLPEQQWSTHSSLGKMGISRR